MIIWSLLTATLVPFVRATTYSTYAASSIMSRGQGNGLSATGSPVVSYEHGEFQWALRLLYEKTGNASYYQYIKAGVDRVIGSDGSVGGGYK